MAYWKHIFCIVISIYFITSCRDKPFTFKDKEVILTETSWVRNSYVDNSTNTFMETPDCVFEFKRDGTFLTIPMDSVGAFASTWEFLHNQTYLRLGVNTYKVKIISNRLIGLEYGSIDIFYVPANR